jgi:dienelactone hydrolase
MKTADITYRDGAVDMSGFVVYDDTVSEKRPGVLVVHEAWGLGKHAMARSRMLADLGYVAFAADLYGGRRMATKMEEVMTLMGDLRANPQKLRARARAALAALSELPQVDATRLGAIGFCFGGTTVLELARDGAEIQGVVSFHGNLETTAPAVAGEVKARVLVCTGADDPMIPATQVASFEEEMHKAGVDFRVITYPGTVHSFTNPEADGSIAPGMLYNKDADQQSWTAMRSFFKDIFAR